MFEEVGKKIKVFAKVMFALEVIGSFIAAILMMEDDDMALICLAVIAGGFLVAWISALFIYGFGELIDKTCEIADNTGSGKAKPETEEEADTEVESTNYSNE